MVKDHTDSKRGNPTWTDQYSFRLPARVLVYAPFTDRIAHATAFVTPVMEHWLEREIAQWVQPMKDRSDDPSHHERTLCHSLQNKAIGRYLRSVYQLPESDVSSVRAEGITVTTGSSQPSPVLGRRQNLTGCGLFDAGLSPLFRLS